MILHYENWSKAGMTPNFTVPNPEIYVKMDRQTLSKALESSPKIIRTVKCNKSLVLLNPDYAMKTQKYSEIGLEEIHRRVKILFLFHESDHLQNKRR